MDHIAARVGYDASWTFTIVDGNGNPITTYAGAEPLGGDVWLGESTATLFSPSVTWLSAAAGTVTLSIAKAQTAGLVAGKYGLDCFLADTSGRFLTIYQAMLTLTSSPGATPLRPTYCSIADMRVQASWIDDLQDEQNDLTGFAEQCAQARDWLDGLILQAFKSADLTTLSGGFTTRFSSSTSRGTLLTNTWLLGVLNANGLVLTIPSGRKAIRACAFYALALACRGQIGSSGQRDYQRLANYYAAAANREASTYVAEIDTNGDGLADTTVVLSNTQTRYT